MVFEPNVFSIILIISGIFTCIIGSITLKSGDIIKWFAYSMLLIGFWAFTYGIALSTSSLSIIKSMLTLKYIGVSFLPATWIIFLIKFTGHEKWLNTRNVTLIFTIPVITLLMVLTNDYHYLFYKNLSVDQSGSFPVLAFKAGPWRTLHVVYFYSIMVLGFYLLASRFKNADVIYKRQSIIILLGAIIPFLINITYLFNYKPFGHIDLTAFGFILTALLTSIGLLRFKLFDIIPIAREKIIELMQEGILVLDSKHRIVDCNAAMKNILISTNSLLIGTPLAQVFDSNSALINSVDKRISKQLELTIEGSPFNISITSLFEKNNYNGTILLFRNITERKRVQLELSKQSDELLQLNQLKDKLLSVIAHDLRSPLINLTEILNYTEEGIVTEEEFRDFLPTFKSNISYTSELLENLLSWSKSQLKGEDAKPVLFDISDLEINRINYYTDRASEKSINMINDLKPSTMVYADLNMVQLVIRNLITNAIKFCGDGDLIRISANKNPNSVTIHIIDTGSGIADADLEKLFKMRDFTTKGTQNEIGSGIGLMICKEFIEKNKGTIGVNSFFGKGSDFYFTLPNN